jgi:hypothetical protein
MLQMSHTYKLCGFQSASELYRLTTVTGRRILVQTFADGVAWSARQNPHGRLLSFIDHPNCYSREVYPRKQLHLWLPVCKQSIPTTWLPLFSKVTVTFCGWRLSRGQRSGSPWPLISEDAAFSFKYLLNYLHEVEWTQ